MPAFMRDVLRAIVVVVALFGATRSGDPLAWAVLVTTIGRLMR